MSNKLRIGVLGMTHDHVWGNLADLKKSPLGELVAAADPNEELRTKVQNEYGCPQVFESYEDMLEEVELDAVYIFADNASGAELAILAATNGLHVLTEKPMAANLDGADRMLAAAPPQMTKDSSPGCRSAAPSPSDSMTRISARC